MRSRRWGEYDVWAIRRPRSYSAAAGIGRTTALTFDAKGYTVGAYDIDEVGLKSLADEIDNLGARAITGHLDVTDTDEMAQRVAEFAKAAGDRLDVMINNAGILLAGPFEGSGEPGF